MSDFKIPQISTLVGSTIGNYFKTLKNETVEPKFYLKVFLTTLVILIATPFHWWEELKFKQKLSKFKFEKQPLFILGHWRSGTTLLHNLLCKAPSAGYLTTYQSTFPNNLGSKWLFKTFMKANMPDKRPSDNVKLNIDFPQEDEFAFCNSQADGYYKFFYFPLNYKLYYERAIHHKKLTEQEINNWYKSYDKVLKKAVLNSKGEQLIVKNPVNTARVNKILKLYPNAKFLYIYRNPLTVFYSTQKFFQKLFPSLWLNSCDHAFIDEMIFDVYKKLMHDYQDQKALIPPENLIELKFETFEKNPIEEIKRIYDDLLNDDFEAAKPYFTEYFDSLSGYKKNKYSVSKSSVNRIMKEWAYFMDLYDYKIPEDIEVVDDLSGKK